MTPTRLWLLVALALAASPAAAQTAAPEDVAVASREKSDVNGYVIEARVPWTLVRTTPTDGQAVGFDVHVNDSDAPGLVRLRKRVWSGSPGDDQHRVPARFGTVVLGAGRDGLPGVPRAPSPPVLDGVTEGVWDRALALPLDHVRLADAAPTPNDLSAVAHVLYDDSALYLLVDVTDNRVVVDGDHHAHTDDSVELYLDGGNEKAERYDLNDARLTFRPGLDGAGLTSLGAGGDYAGREPDAPWRELARARIEAIRKGPLRVEVVDAEGRPVEGAEVHVAMRRHAFQFGAAVEAQLLASDPSPDAAVYRDHVERLYNAAVFTNDFKWQRWADGASEAHPRWRRSWTADAVRWLNERDVLVRGHYVLWSPVNQSSTHPDSLLGLLDRPERLRAAWLSDIRERVPALAALGRVEEWDTINHITGWGPTTTTAIGHDFNAEVMRLARELAPDAEQWVNEGNVLTTGLRVEGYDRDLRELVQRGAAPDGIGFMAHFTDGTYTPPDTLLARFDRFARIVPRLKLTEFDVNTLDDSLQADYLRDVMTAAFSHRAVEGVVMWGFWEGQHWRPDAALYREDWTPKPAAREWERLVFEEWWTDETVATGSDGLARVRAFLGEHEVTVRHEGYEVTERVRLGRDGTTLVVHLGDAAHQRAGTR